MTTVTKKVAPILKADLQKAVDAEPTVSGKIRLLDKAKYSTADISRILNKRYQHVRNVLVEDRRKKA